MPSLQTSAALGLAGGCAAAILASRKPQGHDAAPQWEPRSGPADVDAATSRWQAALHEQGPTGDGYLIVGAGSLGCRIAQALLLRGERRIRFLDTRRPPLLDELLAKHGESEGGLEFFRGDVTKPDEIKAAFAGTGTVYCTFAIIRFWERLPQQAELSHSVNVVGTANILEACRSAGVARFVQTSTSNTALLWSHKAPPGAPPVVLDETSPYVEQRNMINHYGTTKAVAEQLVLEANSPSLSTACIRPCSGIFGARDGIVIEPCLVTKSAHIPAPAIISDWVYIDNVVWGHLLLEKELRAQNPEALGQVFAVSNVQPVRSNDFWRAIAHYEPAVAFSYPPIYVIRGLAHAVEWLTPFVSFPGGLRQLGTMTPATLKLVETSYVYNCEKARRVLGYAPMYTLDEGILASVMEFRNSRL